MYDSRRPTKPRIPTRSRSLTRTSTSDPRSSPTTSPRSIWFTLHWRIAWTGSDDWAIAGPVSASSARQRNRGSRRTGRYGARAGRPWDDGSWATGGRSDVETLGQSLLTGLDLDRDGLRPGAVFPGQRYLVHPAVPGQDVPAFRLALPERLTRRAQAAQPDLLRNRMFRPGVAQLEDDLTRREGRRREPQLGPAGARLDEDRDPHAGQDPHLAGRRGLGRGRRKLLDEDAIRALHRARRDRGADADDALLARDEREQAREEDDLGGGRQRHLPGRVLGPAERVELEAQGLRAGVLHGEDGARALAGEEDLDRVDGEVRRRDRGRHSRGQDHQRDGAQGAAPSRPLSASHEHSGPQKLIVATTVSVYEPADTS